jgi:adenylate kinase family enzyme
MTGRNVLPRSEALRTPLPVDPVTPIRVSERRISVVGASGSGKSCLARVLAEQLGLPLVELDALRWEPSGQELPRDAFVQRVAAAVDDEEWVIDGHYRDVRQLIWQRAQMVVWLNYPLPLVAWRLLTRFGRKFLNVEEAGQDVAAAGRARRLPGQGTKATWGQRLGRFARNLRERHEYRGLLHSSAYQPLTLMEMRSAKAAAEWVVRLVPPV